MSNSVFYLSTLSCHLCMKWARYKCLPLLCPNYEQSFQMFAELINYGHKN